MNTSSDEGPRRPELPGYDVLELLGRGATGAVWSVRGADGVRLAAKVFDADAGQLDYEVTVLESLRHEHVVRLQNVVVDLSTEPAGTALVMELAEGGSLADALALREILTPGELVTVLCPVARALHDLHGLGLVHGDLSPGNILLTGQGKPLIADLGMSRLAGHSGDETWATESWAAPEVLAGGSPVPASDVYSLGAIAWRALTGVPPEPAVLRPDLSELAPDICDELRDLVNSALAHTDSARPLPGEFAISLWQCAKPEPAPVQGSPARRVAVATPATAESDALTRRIREQAAAAGSAEEVLPMERSSLRRVPARARVLLGMAAVTGGVIAFAANGFGAGGGPEHVHAATRPSTLATSAPSSSTPGPAPHTTEQRTASRPPAAASLGAHPVDVVQRLAAARAAAWVSGDSSRLSAAEVEGSPAYRRDSADLRTATDQQLRYRGLTFTVRSAEVRQTVTSGVVRVSTVIDNSAYTVVGAGRSRSVPATRGQRTELSVRWTNHGWRVVDWAAKA
ncbi:protein kinase domain-containing protein [Flexivirga oryzae]|uniref:Serine/threonine protein kinase n=1 Tax=Flexivirga oryzae TaxID=1794944 RepID=A0A839N9M8_9MICO|nr:serine/threonine protein kinase [Flexivirga oryzae]